MPKDLFKLLRASNELFNLNRKLKGMVIHPNKTIRATIVQALSHMGMSANNITLLSGNIEEIRNTMATIGPTVIVCNEFLDDTDFKEVLELHEKLFPYRLEASFIVLSEDGSISGATAQLEYFIDGYLSVPFTTQTLNNTLMEQFELKNKPAQGVVEFNRAREQFLLGKIIAAEKLFSEITYIESIAATCFAFLGLIEEMKGKKDKALEFLKIGVEADADNYISRANYLRVLESNGQFAEAYEQLQELLQRFPFAAHQIPSMVRLSIATNNHKDINDIFKALIRVHLLPDKVKKALSAGLVIFANTLLKDGDFNPAIEAMDNALKTYPSSTLILRKACLLFAEYDLKREAIGLLENFSNKKVSTEDFNEIQFEVLFKLKDYKSILKEIPNIMNGGITKSSIYEIIIQTAVASNLSENRVLDIVDKASKAFPEKKDLFKKYLVKESTKV